MYKKDFIKQIIPDIIVSIGIILLIIGIFNLIESGSTEADKQLTILEKENGAILEEDRELSFIEKAQQRAVESVSKTQEELAGQLNIKLDEEMLMRLPNRNIIIDNYLSKSKDLLKLNGKITKEDDVLKLNKKIIEVDKEDKNELITFIIPDGSSGRDVAKILDENNLVKFDDFIELLLLFDIETRIKAGRYTFDRHSSSYEILSRILIK